MKTIAYIDGFNLYYGGVKDKGYKWLDIKALSQKIIPGDEIVGIKYFSAKVNSTKKDPGKPKRQMKYWQALQSISGLKIVKGHYVTRVQKMSLAEPIGKYKGKVKVWKTEEKRSDVNISAHMVADAFENRYERALLITNDFDLAEPIIIVCRQANKSVVISRPPFHEHHSKGLRDLEREIEKVSVRDMSGKMIRESQFPDPIIAGKATIHCPEEWKMAA